MNQYNIYDYLNIKNKFRNMTDDFFLNTFVNQFASNMYEYGFDNLMNNYNDGLISEQTDWNNLKNQNITNNYMSSTSTVGLSIIKKSMGHIYEVENFKGVSIKKLWTIQNIRKALIINRKTHITPYVSEIIRQLGFSAGTSKVTIYRPLLTKRIVEYFSGKKILDVCTGWGGRMLGTRSVNGTHYTGIEPCLKTYNGLTEIIDILELDNINIYNDTAENILPELPNNYYDMALTSPPYYNLEVYSNEATQSINKYNTYELWYDNFLKPVVYGVLDKLEDGGKSCWSVKNFKTDKKYNLYEDVVKLHEDKGWKKINTEFYVGNCLRPGLKDKNGKPQTGKEITYVFTKN